MKGWIRFRVCSGAGRCILHNERSCCLYDCCTFLLLTPVNVRGTSFWLFICYQPCLWRLGMSDYNYLLIILCLNHDQNKQLAIFPRTLCVLLLDVLVCQFGGVISDTCWWSALTLQRNVLCLSIHSSVCTCLHLNARCRAQCKWHISPSPSCLLPPPVSTCPCLSALIPNNLTVKVNINPFIPPLSCTEAEL